MLGLGARIAALCIAKLTSDETGFAGAGDIDVAANPQFQIFGIPGATDIVADFAGAGDKRSHPGPARGAC